MASHASGLTERLIGQVHAARDHPFAYVTIAFIILMLRLLAEARGDPSTAVAIAANTDLFPLLTKLVLGTYPFVLSLALSLALAIGAQRLVTERRVGNRLAVFITLLSGLVVLVLPLTPWVYAPPVALALCWLAAAIGPLRRRRITSLAIRALVGAGVVVAVGLFLRGTVLGSSPVGHAQIMRISPKADDSQPNSTAPMRKGVVVGYVLRQEGDLTYVLVHQPRIVVAIKSSEVVQSDVCSFGYSADQTLYRLWRSYIRTGTAPLFGLPQCY